MIKNTIKHIKGITNS